MSVEVYRIQDAEGRGPYKPGFSDSWVDPDHIERNPTDVGTILERVGIIQGALKPGESGCFAVATIHELLRWFSPTERQRLGQHGYYIAAVKARVVRRWDNELGGAVKRRHRKGRAIDNMKAESTP